jgi:hypothetical protein
MSQPPIIEAVLTWRELGRDARRSLLRMQHGEPPGMTVAESLCAAGCIRPRGTSWEMTAHGRDVASSAGSSL